ncbi:MAG: hypothetical protein PHD76_04250 [Methylacidiphilales bacterium]|nr:hypothetical protein [Candidatus Methylacidiphilales bacterium]
MPAVSNDAQRSGISGWVPGILVVLLLALHLTQLFSPLRLNTDAVKLLSMAVSASEGNGFLLNGKAAQLPSGYPFVVVCLMKAGLGHAVWLNALNWFCMAAGTACFALYLRKIARASTSESLAMMALVLSSWVIIKHEAIPLSDLLYFLLVQACLLLAGLGRTSTGAGRALGYGGALLLACLSPWVRTAGLSLILAGIFAQAIFWMRMRTATTGKSVPPLMFFTAAGLAVTALFLCWAFILKHRVEGERSYLDILIRQFHKGPVPENMGLIIQLRCSEIAGLFLNLPGSKIHFPSLFLQVAGLFLCIPVLGACFRKIGDNIELAAYLAIYALILSVWPFADARFFIPVLPSLIWLAYLGIREWVPGKYRDLLLKGGFAYFIATGLIALAYSCWLSFSAESFPIRYGDGSYRESYKAAWGQAADAARIKPDVVKLLKQFEPRAQEGR